MDQFQAMDMNTQKLPPTNYSPWDVSFDALWPIMPSSSPSSAQQNQTAVQQDQDQDQEEEEEEEEEQLGAMKEMMFKMASMQPVDIDPASVRKPRRRNVRISDDPQSVAARHRRERISEKIRILQRLVPGGTKMDTASMLDEAVRYLKFLKRQIRHLQAINPATASQIPFPPSVNAAATTSPAFKCNEHQSDQN